MSVIITLVLLVLIVTYMVKYSKYWLVRIRLGLPGPPPPLPYVEDIIKFLGESGDRLHEEQLKLLVNYGRNVAYTAFGQVYILIADPETIKSVTIKQFDCFSGNEAPGLRLKNPPYDSMISISGKRWRRIRNTISPIFTTSMLKNMMFLMRNSVETLLLKIQTAAKQDTMVDAHQYIKQATMEMIVKTSFSIEADSQTNKDDPFLNNAHKALSSVKLIQIMASLPLGDYLVSLFPDPCDFDYMLSVARRIIKQRRQGDGQSKHDFVNLLLKTQENIDEDKKLTDNEILAQSLIFLMAGYDSTSSAVAFLVYCMAIYPEIQKKVQAEIDSVWASPEKEELSYDMLQNMPYLNMCYLESQRLYSIAYITTRLCIEDCDVAGIPFKKGMVAVLPIYAAHRLPDVWPDPEKFIPERFLVEEKAKKQYMFMPFGHGPRNCIGMRFATLNVKMMLVSILKKFNIIKTKETMDPIRFDTTFILNLPVGSITVQFENRVDEKAM